MGFQRMGVLLFQANLVLQNRPGSRLCGPLSNHIEFLAMTLNRLAARRVFLAENSCLSLHDIASR